MKRIVAAVLLAVAWTLSAAGNGAAGADGPLSAELNANGIVGDAADRIVAAARRCEACGLPGDFLRARLREGLAKKAAPETLAAAVETRLKSLEESRNLLGAAGYDDRREPSHRELLESVAHALESGMPPAAFGRVLSRGRGTAALRVQTVVESGESLHLAGLEDETVIGFMTDCLDRNLRRMEILRAARLIVQQHRGGVNSSEIRRALWDDRAPDGGGNPQRSPGRGHGWGGPPDKSGT
jgi:hypothetical protein